MKRFFPSVLIVIPFLLIFTQPAEAQVPDKYKVVQGLGYLHTQVTLILNNWNLHPLNTTPLDEFDEEWQKHLIEEMEHDEEWAEFMLVEDNLLEGFGEGLPPEVEGAVESNLEFYRDVIAMLRTPANLSAEIESHKDMLVEAEDRLYQTIFPAIIR